MTTGTTAKVPGSRDDQYHRKSALGGVFKLSISPLSSYLLS
jgi:hypothetical protein